MILKRTYNLLTSRQNQVNIQFYSIFPTTYVKPIFKKEEQEEVHVSPEGNKLSRIPIRPALTSDTCSEFYDEIVRKFTNYIMRQGKKMVARKVLETTFENIKILQLKKYYQLPPEERDSVILDPKAILHEAIENCSPVLELTNVRRGGILYKVPIPLNEQRAKFLSMNWLIQTANDKPDTDKFVDVLAKELINASNNEGKTIKKKHELHKQCEANRAFAHYRWI
ncbi:mitochondrial ribosomal protein S7 [Megachile rotundata]|uniref:mitochondrial ribosomal protein S7 n=1 Tax=Megachile rotundata TaxID=143995 RepID=UPI000258EEC1|nr:PREDICTED: 28S ribosomal protein S7, mitochondrial [Megachile rotundata]